MGKEIVIRMEGMDVLQKALAAYPKQLKAMTYKLMTDMAVEYKRRAPEVISRHETIRQPGFVKSAFVFERAQSTPGPGIDGIFAVAGSVAAGTSEKYGKDFTGWVEQLDPSIAAKRTRTIGAGARGGSMSGKVKKGFRLDPSKNIPSARDFNGPYNHGKKNARNIGFMAMLHRQNYKGVFILEKDEFPAGLFTFSNEIKENWIFPKPVRLQKFGAEIKEPHFDWHEETLELVRKTFTTQAIFDNYVVVALNKARAQAGAK